ncbi:MAG: phosphoribosyltransferase, partial [Phototrophicaceae bacterium]
MTAPYQQYLAETLIDQNALMQRVSELGHEISRDYANCDTLLLICILKGGVMFLSDLTRHITVPHEIDFMAVSSYGHGVRESKGSVRIDMDLTAELKDKHVLIIEDIIDCARLAASAINVQ